MSRFRSIGIGIAACAGLAACATAPAREMPEYFYQALLSSQLAQTLARDCGSGLSYNEDTWNARLPQIAERMAADGFSQSDTQRLLSNIPQERLKADAAAYIAENGLVPGQAQTFCAAGRAEITAGSEIGSFLKGGA